MLKKNFQSRCALSKKMFKLTEICAIFLFYDVSTEFHSAFVKNETLWKNKHFRPTLICSLMGLCGWMCCMHIISVCCIEFKVPRAACHKEVEKYWVNYRALRHAGPNSMAGWRGLTVPARGMTPSQVRQEPSDEVWGGGMWWRRQMWAWYGLQCQRLSIGGVHMPLFAGKRVLRLMKPNATL